MILGQQQSISGGTFHTIQVISNMNLDGLLGRHLVIPSRLARLQFIKGFTPPHLPSYAIHSSIIRPRPGMSLMLDRARFKIVFFCPRFDLTLDGFSRPEANSLVFEFTFERDLLVAVHARPTYIFTSPGPTQNPNFFTPVPFYSKSSLWEIFQIFRLLSILCILCVQLLLGFVG